MVGVQTKTVLECSAIGDYQGREIHRCERNGLQFNSKGTFYARPPKLLLRIESDKTPMIILACDKCKEFIRAPSDYVQFDYTGKVEHSHGADIQGRRDYYCMECWSKLLNNMRSIIINAYGLGPILITKRYMSDDHCPTCGE